MNYHARRLIVVAMVSIVLIVNVTMFARLFKKSNSYKRYGEKSFYYQKTEMLLEHDVVHFLEQFWNIETGASTMFVVDHVLLSFFIESNQLDLLIERGYLPSEFATNQPQSKLCNLTFGVFATQFQLMKSHFPYLLSIGWSIKTLTANGKYLDTLDPIQPIQLFFHKADTTIHLLIFYPRNNYYWIGGIPHHLRPLLSTQAWYNATQFIHGKHDAIYDSFELFNSLINFPTDLVYFLMQFRSSKFIDCSDQQAKHFLTLNPVPKSQNEAQVQNRIRSMKFLSKHLMVDIWMISSSLLNWYRSCGLYFESDSLEYGFRADQLNENENITESILDGLEVMHESTNEQLFMELIFGNLKNGIQIHFKDKYYRSESSFVKLIGYYQKNESFFSKEYNVILAKRKVVESIFEFPFSSLCSIDYLGEKTFIPCAYYDTIMTEFGSTWSIPIAKWQNVYATNTRVNNTMKAIESVEVRVISIPESYSWTACLLGLLLVSLVLGSCFAFLKQTFLKQKKNN